MSVIDVEHVEKVFRIPHEKRTTIFEALTGLLRPTDYETFSALRDVTFSVEEGEMLGIIGENGSGKSTLLKILAGIMRPTSGRVSVHRRLTPFLELGVGFNPDFTAVENIRTYGTIMGLSKREINGKVDEILAFAGLETFRDAKLKNFSSGMQVRLAFSTAIQTNPEILLMDEVLAVGDMEFQQKCMDVLNRYRNEGVTIVFVSHDLGSVRRFCDRTLLLNHGEQVALGNTNEVIDKYVYKNIETLENGANSGFSPEFDARKQIAISGVGFIDKFGRERQNFRSQDPLTVRIFFQSKKQIESPIFGIAIYNGDLHYYGTTSESGGLKLGRIGGSGYIDFYIPHLCLGEGKYDLTVAIASSDYQTQYDWRDKMSSFYVHNVRPEEGLVSIEGKWTIKLDD
jgi:lipopolysaccharide transport system ATP-binding protein